MVTKRQIIFAVVLGYFCSTACFLILTMSWVGSGSPSVIVWQELDIHDPQVGERYNPGGNRSFYWDEIPRSKLFYTRVQKRMFGEDSTAGPSRFEAGVMPEEWNSQSDKLILWMYAIPDNPPNVQFARFEVGMRVFWDELKKRDILTLPLGEPSIWRYPNKPLGEDPYLIPIFGSLSLCGVIPVVLYLVMVTRRKTPTEPTN